MNGSVLSNNLISWPAHPSLTFRNVKWTYMQNLHYCMQKLHYQQGDEVHSRVLNQLSYVANMYLHVIVLIMCVQTLYGDYFHVDFSCFHVDLK